MNTKENHGRLKLTESEVEKRIANLLKLTRAEAVNSALGGRQQEYDLEHTLSRIMRTIADELRTLKLQVLENRIKKAEQIMSELRVWWDRVYPEDIFPVQSPVEEREEGPEFVARIRKLLNEWEKKDDEANQ